MVHCGDAGRVAHVAEAASVGRFHRHSTGENNFSTCSESLWMRGRRAKRTGSTRCDIRHIIGELLFEL